ncbi:hypothetical protein LCGC14_2909050, partial [marine sediment metagenome]
MAVSVKFGTFALDNYVESWSGSVRRRIVQQVIPRKDGVRIDLGKLSGFEVTVTGGWEAASATALRTA